MTEAEYRARELSGGRGVLARLFLAVDDLALRISQRGEALVRVARRFGLDELERFNPNHLGHGPGGGQFAPARDGSIIPVQSGPIRLIPPLIGAVRRWLQRAPRVPKEPELPPSDGPGISGHIPNIVASVDSYLEGPKDLEELNEAAQSDSEPGYQDHHIVEQGPQNDDLGADETKRINDPENIVRIPYYTHQQITNYYRNPDFEPPISGLTPRQYLRGKSFDERYQFGLNKLREFGILK